MIIPKKNTNFVSRKKHTAKLCIYNFDRYFKKVFSDLNIAKRFLEDFFEDRKLKVKSDFLNEKARKKDSSKVFVFITKDSIYKLRYEFITEKLESFITIGEIEDYYKSNIDH